jgi:Protein of unknown function/Domain of unknown function (DUF1835)
VRPSTVHIVFGPMAAASLEMAIRQAGREDRVVCHQGNLALGPIDPPEPHVRSAWMDRELPPAETSAECFPDDSAFWKEALRDDVRKVAWMSRRSAPEYCGFLEWLWRLGGQPCEVVDLTDMPVGNRRRAFSLSLLDPEEIVDNGLLDRTTHLDAAARAYHLGIWRRLRTENAPLRVVGPNGIQSAQLSYFDAQLLSFAKASWQKPARIIGEVICEWVAPEMEPYFQAGDGVLAARIPVLVEQGLLEGRGNLLDMRASEVRLPG